MPGWRLASSCTRQRKKQRQRVVEHVRSDCQHEPGRRCQVAHPSMSRLQTETEECAEQTREKGVPPEPEESIAAAELCAIRRGAILGVALSDIKRCLEPIKAEAYESAVDNAVSHVIKFGAQQPKDQQYSKGLRYLLH